LRETEMHRDVYSCSILFTFENTNFYRILLDARMQKAARLVLDSDTHINKVSYAVGMSSVSYFIKLFSDYYGLTPKQFHLKYKHRNTGEKAAFML
ncbi:helix-turn-helix domain-containing protein, partial [Salmonella enterica subsp. enterica serovar Enteritidis]|nr:helix-turn-helix domain-containing protein [Salmonella enterica subsp. enterica serovar Enteritidis]